MMDQGAVQRRGSLGFEVGADGNLVNNAANVERLRRLWLDRSVIHGDLLGPGDPGDFDHGAWHVACHLVAAGGVRRAVDGRMLWLEISHDATRDLYYASVTYANGPEPRTLPVDSAEGVEFVAGSTLLGFVEGTSTGRISARGVADPEDMFNSNPRQEYDQPADSPAEGGKVWEHWCTLRDIRSSAAIGSSVLAAYVALLSVFGDAFAAIVARGRREYHHPEQLGAMVAAGLISRAAALISVKPTAIPAATAHALCLGDARIALRHCEALDWQRPPRYYMFERKIDSWVDEVSIA
jgi:hypothetical protein